jgi:hypothetical protein
LSNEPVSDISRSWSPTSGGRGEGNSPSSVPPALEEEVEPRELHNRPSESI